MCLSCWFISRLEKNDQSVKIFLSQCAFCSWKPTKDCGKYRNYSNGGCYFRAIRLLISTLHWLYSRCCFYKIITVILKCLYSCWPAFLGSCWGSTIESWCINTEKHQFRSLNNRNTLLSQWREKGMFLALLIYLLTTLV